VSVSVIASPPQPNSDFIDPDEKMTAPRGQFFAEVKHCGHDEIKSLAVPLNVDAAVLGIGVARTSAELIKMATVLCGRR
jgi:hypothetical protein